MTLSRTARILIALLLVAAAAFIWINLFISSPASGPILARTATTPVQAANQPATVPEEEDAGTPPDPFAQVEDPDASEGGNAAEGRGPGELPFITIPADDERTDAPADGATSDDPAGAQAPTVVAADEATVVGRDVVVAEFPFLITAPPLTEDAEEPAAEAAADASRPGTVARASVNPFSPIVVQAPQQQQAQAQATTPPASPEVVEVEVPAGPPQPAAGAAAAASRAPAVPTPRPLAPNTAGARRLPRALPAGTLPVAPDLLREPRAEAAPRTQVTVPNVAIREPDVQPEGAPGLAPVDADLAADAAGDDLAPLGPGEIPASGRAQMPLVAGADPLNRYLRDHNVTFTGSVVGSVGVGVFRTIDRNAPIVLALGQTLPDSDIVLTDLRGQAAEFTLGDTSQVLNLDLRR